MLRLRHFSGVDGRVLVLVVVLGGLLTLQGSSNLDAPKIAYLLLAAAAVAVALAGAPWGLSDAHPAIARPWLITAGAFVALLIVSLAVARAHGTPFTSSLRDAAPCALFAAAPIHAFACARERSGFVAETTFEEGLRHAIEWHEAARQSVVVK